MEFWLQVNSVESRLVSYADFVRNVKRPRNDVLRSNFFWEQLCSQSSESRRVHLCMKPSSVRLAQYQAISRNYGLLASFRSGARDSQDRSCDRRQHRDRFWNRKSVVRQGVQDSAGLQEHGEGPSSFRKDQVGGAAKCTNGSRIIAHKSVCLCCGFRPSKGDGLMGDQPCAYSGALVCSAKSVWELCGLPHRGAVPGAEVESEFVDLADLRTVRAFAKKALDAGAPLDVLVNNAGKGVHPLMWRLWTVDWGVSDELVHAKSSPKYDGDGVAASSDECPGSI